MSALRLTRRRKSRRLERRVSCSINQAESPPWERGDNSVNRIAQPNNAPNNSDGYLRSRASQCLRHCHSVFASLAYFSLSLFDASAEEEGEEGDTFSGLCREPIT